MSDRNRSNRSATKLVLLITGGLALLAAFLGAVWWGESKQLEYQRESESRQREYASRAYAPARNSCLKLPFLDQPNCIADAAQKYRENERGEQDLVAQRVTAIWTSIMGGAAVLGMMLSVVGVFLVWTTFRETKDANEISKVAAGAQIVVTEVTLELENTGEHPYSPHISVKLKNAGPTVAHDVMFNGRCEVAKRGEPVIDSTLDFNDRRGALIIDPGQPDNLGVRVQSPEFAGLADGMTNGEVEITVRLQGKYRTVFGGAANIDVAFKSAQFIRPGNEVNTIMVRMARTA